VAGCCVAAGAPPTPPAASATRVALIALRRNSSRRLNVLLSMVFLLKDREYRENDRVNVIYDKLRIC
jgi:hypothetical protein